MADGQEQRDGLIFSEHASETGRYMHGHGLATLFLAGFYEDEGAQNLHDILTCAARYIVKAQSTQGGWYHTSRMEGHDLDVISATAMQIQALQAAEKAFKFDAGDSINDAQEYLKKIIGKHEQKPGPGPSHRRTAETAAALACRNLPGVGLRDAFCKKWFKYCQAEIPTGRALQFGRDEITHYYYTQVLFDLSGDSWSDARLAWSGYRTAMFDHLQKSQNQDGRLALWDAQGAGDVGVGPVHAAAVWCTILQLDNKSHPLSNRNKAPHPLLAMLDFSIGGAQSESIVNQPVTYQLTVHNKTKDPAEDIALRWVLVGPGNIAADKGDWPTFSLKADESRTLSLPLTLKKTGGHSIGFRLESHPVGGAVHTVLPAPGKTKNEPVRPPWNMSFFDATVFFDCISPKNRHHELRPFVGREI